ncbi:glycosyl hydrolase family 8 [Palleronia sp. LCG004]|uniref:glycosyl hydrolase family 8 n=1 Tax=Palleronia sp. LCG004 TaxID=3079304 RepID=UPI0029431931|nr:glycosyl hydrolase family 8 [Palleronia sp. LCG004]WOI57974.1 glycosyl hydrolase family 8 [Palleronia sp. LCG004]
MQRRTILGIAGAASGGALFSLRASARAAAGASDDWSAWKAAFLTPEGRIVDALQGDASHSEGQGWGLLLAHAEGDREAFDRILDWTDAHLAQRRDPLLAWRWKPGPGIDDYNNASDGDLFHAWALLRAARTRDDPRLAERAERVARAIDTILVRPSPLDGDALLLRPAAERFSAPGSETINPSYYMPRALQDLAAAFALPRLAQVSTDGEALLARLARSGPLPDWIAITKGGPAPAKGLSALHSYDAMRAALYLVWSARAAHPAVTASRKLDTTDGVPVSVDPATGAVLERSDAPGYAALSALVAATGQALPAPAPPPFTTRQSYYPATLQLLVRLAARDLGHPPHA